MGLIQRQTFSGTIFTYAGVILGFITSALIFPRYLTTEQIGLLGVFLSYSYLFGQLATLGTGRITIVFFPYFKDRARNHHGFFFLMGIIALIGLVLSLAAFYFLRTYLIENSGEKSRLLAENIDYLVPLIMASLFFLVFDSFYKNLYNAVQGIIMKEFLQRLLILAFILLLVFGLISFDQYLPLYVLALALPPLILFINLLRNKEFTFKPYALDRAREYRRKMISIGFYGILIGFSGMVILNIDRIMVERMLGLGATGIYTTMAYFATLVIIPSRALVKISDPVIAQFWKDGDMKSLQDNYYRSSLNQYLIGALLLVGIYGNLGNINAILPEKFAAGNLVILFIGLAFLTDMATGTATYILANSRYFKYQTYFIMLLMIFIVITNYLLIPVWGITGAAVATFISKFLNNLMRHQLIYRKFKLQPYDRKYLYITLIAAVAYFAGYLLPELSNLYLDIAVRSALIGGIFILITLLMKVSPEVDEKYEWLIRKIKSNK